MIPCLRYRNAPAAIDWLCATFGFAQKLLVPGPDGTIRHSQLTLGCGMVMVGSSPTSAPSESLSTLIVVPDVESVWQSALRAGAEIVTELQDQEDRGLFFACRDLEGYIWNVGCYDPWT